MHILHCRAIAQRPLVAEAGAKMHFVSESVSHPVWLPAALLHMIEAGQSPTSSSRSMFCLCCKIDDRLETVQAIAADSGLRDGPGKLQVYFAEWCVFFLPLCSIALHIH